MTAKVSPPRRGGAHMGFTLVELMVVLAVIALLSSLTLTGLAGVRQRVKIDKTRSTIRKLHEIVVPHYESYLTRRVTPLPGCPVPVGRLGAIRLLMSLEMPDQWEDVGVPTTGLPTWARTAPVRRYAAMKADVPPSLSYESAECLALLALRGGIDADLGVAFRPDELGDVDGDGYPEMLDAWGKPIGFIRWPAGFESPLQPRDAETNPDPFDPMGVSTEVDYPVGFRPPPGQRDYGLTPLIFSGGPDAALDPIVAGPLTPHYGGYYAASDLVTPPPSWVGIMRATSGLTAPSTRSISGPNTGPNRPGTSFDLNAVRDNITNFDFLRK